MNNMRKHRNLLLIMLSSISIITSCSLFSQIIDGAIGLDSSDNGTSSNSLPTSDDPSSNASNENSIDTSVVENPIEKTQLKGVTIQQLKKHTNAESSPTTGTGNKILIIPVEFTDKKFTSGQIEVIKKATSGTSDDTNYWESLGSFYEKSSYGKLSFDFVYADPINVGMTAQAYYEKYSNYEEDGVVDSERKAISVNIGPATALSLGVEAYRTKYGNDAVKQLDQDQDGYIDSTIMLYAEKTQPSYHPNNTEFYWDFRYYAYNIKINTGSDASTHPFTVSKVKRDVESPVGMAYVWMSYYTLTKYVNAGQIDAHTLIHEYGHMLGAQDYYNSSTDKNHKEYPSGGKHMMSSGILDHDAFCKLQYGWVSPYYPNDEMTLTIGSFESTGDVILLADKDGWNGTPFDEYVLLELFTPTGLNELDSKNVYSKYASSLKDGSGYSKPGIRMWHVDNRICETDIYNNGYVNLEYANDEDIGNGQLNKKYAFVCAHNNYSNAYSLAKLGNFKTLSLISAQKKKFMKVKDTTDSDRYSFDIDLFHGGDKFSLADQSVGTDGVNTFSSASFFTKGGMLMNNGNEFPWEVEVVSISGTGKDAKATIKITKANQ